MFVLYQYWWNLPKILKLSNIFLILYLKKCYIKVVWYYALTISPIILSYENDGALRNL